jgi:hypothetical protein
LIDDIVVLCCKQFIIIESMKAIAVEL